jgi:hypothetical protein
MPFNEFLCSKSHRRRASAERAGKSAYQEQDNECEQQNLRDPGRQSGKPKKSEEARNQCQDQERQSPTEHQVVLKATVKKPLARRLVPDRARDDPWNFPGPSAFPWMATVSVPMKGEYR